MMTKKGVNIIYLGAGKALHNDFNIVYQDINNTRDLGGDMQTVDLTDYDFILCSPPCNFWSRARGLTVSDYSLKTKDILPNMINKLGSLNKPFVIENVINKKRFIENNLFNIAFKYKLFIYFIGRHTYFTNCFLEFETVDYLIKLQRQDFKNHGYVIKYSDMSNCYHQGGYNVFVVFDCFLKKFVGGLSDDE